MPKRKCGNNKDWETEFPYIKKRSEHDVFCIKCSSKFSVAASGRADIIQHLKMLRTRKQISQLLALVVKLLHFSLKKAFDSSHSSKIEVTPHPSSSFVFILVSL